MRVQGQDWLEAWWLPADDPWPASGIQGYSFKWSLNPSEVPAAVINTAAISATSGILSEGAWYFLIRARDNAGSWSPPAIDGPYVIDKTPPANPSFSQFTSQPIRQTWTTHCNLQVNWTAPADPAPGSGIWAYSVKWDDRPDTLPPAVPSTYAATSSYCASNGNSWYVHVRTVDNQGNWAATAAHYGPFYVDMTIPYCHVNTPEAVDDSEWLLTWQIKSVSPVADFEVRYKDVTANSGWMTLVGPTIDTQALFANTQPGHVYDFSCRATSWTGSVGDWSGGYDQRTRVETIDFEVTGLEAVQTVQDLNNSVPLITQKRTFVRFHVRAPFGDFNEPVKARLWVTLSGQTMAVLDPFESPILPRFNPNRGIRSHSFLFEVPTEWVTYGLELTAEVNGDHDYAEKRYDNNSLTIKPAMASTHDLCMVMIPTRPYGYPAYTVNDAGFWDIVSTMQRFYPQKESAPRIFTATGIAGDWNLAGDEAWGDILDELEEKDEDVIDPSCAVTHYYGMLSPAVRPVAKWAGMGNRPGKYATGIMDPTTIAFSGLADGGYTIAHEVGHNLGRMHVRCTGREGNPGYYPYTDCKLGVVTVDNEAVPGTFYGFSVGLASQLRVMPPESTADLMSYAGDTWTSDYTYNALLAQLYLWGELTPGQAAQAAQPEPAAASALITAPYGYLRASGSISPTAGTVQLNPFFRREGVKSSILQAEEQAYEPGMPYSLTLQSVDGIILASQPFTPTIAEAPNGMPVADAALHFSVHVPYDAATAAVVVYRWGTEIGRRTVTDNPPVVTILSPAGGEEITGDLTVSWQGSDQDGDALKYIVRYTPDDGITWQTIDAGTYSTTITVEGVEWLPGGTRARVQVMATDGVNTTAATSQLFSLPRHAPQVHVLEPEDGTSHPAGGPVTLAAAGLDAEDGSIVDPARITWSSDQDGNLGSGPRLQLTTLSPGRHRITVDLTDSDDQTASASITINVVAAGTTVYLPVIVR